MTDEESKSDRLSPEDGKERKLIDDIEEFTKALLSDCSPIKVAQRKVIHDPIFGSNVFEPHEIAIIDSPIVQRLRRISQTDVASLVYPSANHNRLEHSLSVATIANKIIESLLRRQRPDYEEIIKRNSQIEVRLAAILHDIGHGVFSHLSEEYIRDFPEVRSYYTQNSEKFSRNSPHEMLSYLIIKSTSFNDFFEKNIKGIYPVTNEVSLDRVANAVIPIGRNDNKFGWQGDIINGPFDADKFDYLQRDAYFSGLKIGIDLDRFLHCVWLETSSGKPLQLKILTIGATTVEQILFGKLMLYNTIYHHHKIRAAECAIKGIFEMIKENLGSSGYQIHDLKMYRAIDYLMATEGDILSLIGKATELRGYIRNFLNRQLFKRALVISADTVVNPKEQPGYEKFKSLSEYPGELRKLEEKIDDGLGNKYSKHNIWIDLPETLTFEESMFANIQDEGSESDDVLYDKFRVKEWLTAYGSNKWKGYVFSLPNQDIRDEVGKKAAQIISEEYEFEFKEEAFEQAKKR